jgi:hypothetical protein
MVLKVAVMLELEGSRCIASYVDRRCAAIQTQGQQTNQNRPENMIEQIHLRCDHCPNLDIYERQNPPDVVALSTTR